MDAVHATASFARRRFGALAEALLIAAIVAALVMAFAPVYRPADWFAGGDVAAAKGGNGNGRGHNAQPVAGSVTLTATPSEASAWGTRIDVNGCGFEAAPVELRVIHSAGATESYGVGVWADGCMAGTYFLTQEPGLYTIEVYQSSRDALGTTFVTVS